MANLRDVMNELEFEQIMDGVPTMWKRSSGSEEILVGQLSDGELQVSRTVAGALPLVVRLNRFDDGLEALLREWLLVDA